MRLSKEECRVLACMRAASRFGRRQILWQAEQVVRLEKLLSKREQGIASLRQCRECRNHIPEPINQFRTSPADDSLCRELAGLQREY
jgi:hypothetical protein